MNYFSSIKTAIGACLICGLVLVTNANPAGAADLTEHVGRSALGADPIKNRTEVNEGDKTSIDRPAPPAGADTNDPPAPGAAAPETTDPAQPSHGAVPRPATIIVAGRALIGPQSLSHQRGDRTFLPIASIAYALGDVLKVNSGARTVEVRRQTGVLAEFNALLNQVSENGSVILSVSNTADIIFTPNPDDLVLPIEIVAALLDASIRLDEAERVIHIVRGQISAETVRTGPQRSAFELYQVYYDYNLNKYSGTTNQGLTLLADGRIGDGRFSLVTNSNIGAGAPVALLRSATFTYERPNGQRFTGGDLGTGTDLLFMSSTLRGVSAQVPFKGARVTAFGGRTVSGAALFHPEFELIPDPQENVPKVDSPRYDTNVFGAYATFGGNSGNPFRGGQLLFSAGIMAFNGPDRSGEMITASARYASARTRFQGDVGIGRFKGTLSDGSRVNGAGLAADLSASYDLSDSLTLQGRYKYSGANFLGPQVGLHDPVSLAAGGVTWQPVQWLAASVAGSFSTSQGTLGNRQRFLTTTVNLTPRGSWPTVFLSHTQNSAGRSAGAYTLLSAAKDFSRWRVFLNATRIKTAGLSSVNALVGGSLRVNEFNTVQWSQSIGSRGALGGGLDWNGQSFLNNRLSLGAGFNYSRSAGSGISTSERLLATVKLPRESTLQFTYVLGQTGPQYLLSLRGSVLRNKRAEAGLGESFAELNAYGSFYGRVYQDINLNGQFDPSYDTPQANVKIRVDSSRYVVSNESGQYRIDNIQVGDHEVQLDLLSVRADLTLLDHAQQRAILLKGRDSIVDFRLVRTGRITGIVWNDTNKDGKLDEGEQPLSDVRVVAGSGKDTLTDENGVFSIGDLVPGEHAILIDEKTLPEQKVSATGTISVQVIAGSQTANVDFPITPAAPEIKRFTTAVR